MTITVDGATSADRGRSYEAQIRAALSIEKPQLSQDSNVAPELQKFRPDGQVDEDGIEIKYTDDFADSMYNSERLYPFRRVVDDMIKQALTYVSIFPNGILIYITNDVRLAKHYVDLFKRVNITNCKFVIIPSRRG